MHERFAFKCYQSPTKFQFTDNLNKHIFIIHGRYALKCDILLRNFNSDNFNNIFKQAFPYKNMAKNGQCDQCPTKFQFTDNLNKHI